MAMTELNAESFLDSTSWEASEFAWDPRKLVAAPAAGAASQPYIKQPLQMPMASGGSGSDVSETGLNAQAPSPSGGITPTSPPVLVRRCQPKMGPPSTAAQNMCRVQGCGKSLAGEKAYYKRYSICEEHLRSLSLMVDGTLSRFCFQCGKFEGLENFEGDKRSCRTQLQEHNKRRRKGGVLRRQSRRGRKATAGSPTKAPKRRSARHGDEDDTDMAGNDTHHHWAGQQRTLAAAKEQVVAPLPVAPVVGLQMEDLVGPTSVSGRSSDYTSTEACLPQEPSVQASAFAGGSAFMGRRASLGRTLPSSMKRMPSAVDPFEEALSKFALESGCGGLGDVDMAYGMTRTQSTRDAALWSYPGSNLQPGGLDAAHFLQPRHSSTELIERVLNGTSQSLSSVPPVTEGVFTGESFTGGRPNPAELQRGMWQASAALVNENWQAHQAPVAPQQHQQQECKPPLLQPFLSEPPPRQGQHRALAPQNSGPTLNSPFTSLASAPLQPPAPASTAFASAVGSMGPPASTTPAGTGGMGGMGSLSFACSLQRALSGGSLQRALSGSLFSLPSLPLESLLGRGDSLLPPVAPLPMTKSEPADSFAAAQRLSAGYGANAVRYTPSELNIRLAMKLPNCTPDQLPPDMHAALGRALAAGDMTLMQGFLRPGCVQLVVDVRKRLCVAEGASVQAIEQELTGASSQALEHMGWAPLASIFANASTRRSALMQLGDAGAVVENGRLQRQWQGADAAGAPELLWAGPCCVVSEPGCAVVVAGNGLRTEGLKMFARSQGAFLSTTASPAVPTRAGEAHLPDSSLLLQLDAPPASGLAFVEFEHSKLLSRAVPLLLVDDAHMAMEISDGLDGAVRFGSAAERLMAEQLLIDLGVLLEYHASWERLSAAGDASALPEMVAPVQAVPDGADATASLAAAAALSPVGSDLARALQQRRMQNTAAAMRAVEGEHVADAAAQKAPVEEARAEMVSLGCRLLEHCCDRGWQHTCGRIVTVLLALGCSFAEVVAATAGPDGLSLLHRAVRSGSAAMVAAVLALGEQQWYKWEWQTPGPWGLTPLHLAAAVADDGRLAELLLNKHPDACQVWLSAATIDGQTPAQHASKLGLDHLNQIAQLGTIGALVRASPAKLVHGAHTASAGHASSSCFASGASGCLSSSAGNSGGALARAAAERAETGCGTAVVAEDLLQEVQPVHEPVAAVGEATSEPKAVDAVPCEVACKGCSAPAVRCSTGGKVVAGVLVVLFAFVVFQVLEALNCSPWCICKSICLLAWALVPSVLLSSAKAKQKAQGALSSMLQGPSDCASAFCSLVQECGPVRLHAPKLSSGKPADATGH